MLDFDAFYGFWIKNAFDFFEKFSLLIDDFAQIEYDKDNTTHSDLHKDLTYETGASGRVKWVEVSMMRWKFIEDHIWSYILCNNVSTYAIPLYIQNGTEKGNQRKGMIFLKSLYYITSLRRLKKSTNNWKFSTTIIEFDISIKLIHQLHYISNSDFYFVSFFNSVDFNFCRNKDLVGFLVIVKCADSYQNLKAALFGKFKGVALVITVKSSFMLLLNFKIPPLLSKIWSSRLWLGLFYRGVQIRPFLLGWNLFTLIYLP